MEYALAYDLFLETHVSRNVTVTSSHTGPVIQLCVISKEPAQTCYGCGDSWRGGCSAASASSGRHDD